MEISFASRKMQRLCANDNAMIGAWGTALAVKLMLRLTEMEAAESLQDLRKLPQTFCREHPTILGRLSVNLAEQRRLAFGADHNPLPGLATGGLDWRRVTRICVLDVLGPFEINNEGEGDIEEALRA